MHSSLIKKKSYAIKEKSPIIWKYLTNMCPVSLYHRSKFCLPLTSVSSFSVMFCSRLKKGRGFFCEVWEDLGGPSDDWIRPPAPIQGSTQKVLMWLLEVKMLRTIHSNPAKAQHFGHMTCHPHWVTFEHERRSY